jgi:glycosyltransferase involved in cell wall biosynthesis
MAPTVSVVIPTSGKRPALLARAISSACAAGHQVEVIVVANGPNAFQFELPAVQFDGEIKVLRIEEPGVSNARNLGLDAASGELVRFLDDDDYLLPENAALQYDLAFHKQAAVVSGQIRVEDDRGFSHGSSAVLDADPCCDLLAARMVVLPLAHVFRTSVIRHLRWDVSLCNAEDVDWLHRVTRDGEHRWLPFNETVGVWYQHRDHSRLSYTSINNEATVVSSESILKTLVMLDATNRLNSQRNVSAALGLWSCAHKAFYLSPIYWSKIAAKSMAIDPALVSRMPLYRKAAQLHLPPLAIDWLMIPKRYLNHCARILGRAFSGTSHVRKF